jgi:hypothetical protein
MKKADPNSEAHEEFVDLAKRLKNAENDRKTYNEET